jgi:phage shock protein A
MLDKAEDPEKLLKLMIREMEDTLVELKANCAGVIADRKKLERRLSDLRNRQLHWEGRARLAVESGRDDLAREALIEKRRFTEMTASLENEQIEHTSLVNQYHEDIRQLEEKLEKAREKQRMLVHRHIRAKQAKQAQHEIRRAENFETFAKFDDLESRIERMEAEADLVNFGRKPTLDEAFDELLADDEIESELAELKAASQKKNTSGVSSS